METASGRASPSFCHSPQLYFPHNPPEKPQCGTSITGEAAIMLKAPADAPFWATKSLEHLGNRPELLAIGKKECKWKLLN